MDNEPVYFIPPCGECHDIPNGDLRKYPDSMLSASALGRFRGHHTPNGHVPTDIPCAAMNQIAYFYAHDAWKNPSLYKNRWVLHNKGASIYLDENCDFLGLPTDIEDHEEEEDPIWDGMGDDDEIAAIQRELEEQKRQEQKRQEEYERNRDNEI